jgi:hypothetical protein
MFEITAAGGSLILRLFSNTRTPWFCAFESSSDTQNRRLLNRPNTRPPLDGTAMRRLFERISWHLSFKLCTEFMNALWNK